MATISLEDFKTSIADLCRPNRFMVAVDDIDWDDDFTYLVKSASIPSRTVGNIELRWQGMVYPIPGDPTFDHFSIICLNDIDYEIKTYFEEWFEQIATMSDNTRGVHDDVKATIIVTQINGGGEAIREYRFMYAHPIQMDAIELDHDNTDQVEHFSVTFAYAYFEVVDLTEEA